MKEAAPIEQPDIPEDKKQPAQKPDNLWYGKEKFDPAKHREALRKARTGNDPKEKEERRRLEAQLANIDSVDKKTIKPEDLRALDESVMLTEKDKKAPKAEQKAKEQQAFMKIMKTLQDTDKLPVQAEKQTFVFEFKGLRQNGKNLEQKETEKVLEHIDQGGDVPPNIEFQFRVPFKKGNEANEVMNIDYLVNLHQIMREGLEKTLSSLLSLSYAAVATYDARKAKAGNAGAETAPAPKEKNENPSAGPLEELRKSLQKNNVPTNLIVTGEWSALEVSLPEKHKQLAVVYDGSVFQVTEKREDKSVELGVKTPQEIIEYIEKESK